MRAELPASLLLVMALGGCAEKMPDAGDRRSSAPARLPEPTAVPKLTIPDFVLVDRSEETHRKYKAEDLRGSLAYLRESVGLEVGGKYIEIAPAETLLIIRVTEVFTVSGDGQRTFRLSLIAGSSTDGKRQRRSAEIEIVGVPQLNGGKARVEVSVQVGGVPPTEVCGDVIIWAKETTSGTDLMVRRVK